MSIIKKYSVFIILLTLIPISVSFKSVYNLYVSVAIQTAFALMIVLDRKLLVGNQRDYKWLIWYFIWLAICVLRGVFVASNYFEYKQLMIGTIACITPIVIYLFDDPRRTSHIMNTWFNISLLLILLFVWSLGVNQWYLAPYLLLFCFFPLIKKKKIKAFVFILSILYISLNLDARAQVVKGIVSLMIGLFVLLTSKYRPKLMRIGHFLGYFSIVLLFAFVLTDATGVLFGSMDSLDAKMNNEARASNRKDSRSMILIDVLESSINHDYVFTGHTPARGYEIGISSVLFYDLYEDDRVFNKNERHKNEMVLTNIYTWLGLIGLVLYSLLYFRASYLAVYKSNNKYIPLLGCFIAFRWSLGWIEDVNNFYIQDISLWMMIAMCLSSKFRAMTDTEYISWINSLVGGKKSLKIYENSCIVNRTQQT